MGSCDFDLPVEAAGEEDGVEIAHGADEDIGFGGKAFVRSG